MFDMQETDPKQSNFILLESMCSKFFKVTAITFLSVKVFLLLSLKITYVKLKLLKIVIIVNVTLQDVTSRDSEMIV